MRHENRSFFTPQNYHPKIRLKIRHEKQQQNTDYFLPRKEAKLYTQNTTTKYTRKLLENSRREKTHRKILRKILTTKYTPEISQKILSEKNTPENS